MRILIKRLDHVQICMPHNQEEVARKFYSELLGFAEIEKPNSLKTNGGLWYSLGDISLHIGVEEMEAYQSKRHPAFEVYNLIEIRQYLDENNIKTYDEKPIPNIERFSIFDPFGNRIEFLEKKL